MRITLLDVSLADVAARTLAEATLHDVSHAGGKGIGHAFCLSLMDVDPRVHYAVRVHVDVDGDGRVSRGDYVSTESAPVLTFGHGDEVEIRVRRVRP